MKLTKLTDNKSIIILIVLCLALSLPLLFNITNWGRYEWGSHIEIDATIRESVMQNHEFPFWNKYVCGGVPLFANPQSRLFSPFFIFTLLFGEFVGLKLEIIIHLLIGLLGMYFLARYKKISLEGSILASVVYMFSTVFPLQVLSGTTEWMSMAILPFIILFLLKSFSDKKNIIIASILLALVFFDGGLYTFPLIILFLMIYGIFESVFQKRIELIKIVLIIIIFAVLLTSIKLIPTLTALNDGSIGADVKEEYTSFNTLIKGLFQRNQGFFSQAETFSDLHDKALNSNQSIRSWIEYGAYIGIIVFLLLLMSFLNFKEKSLTLTILICLILYFGHHSIINLWFLLKKLPFYEILHTPSRFLFLIIFGIGLLSARGLDNLFERKNLFKKNLKIFIVLIVILDLFIVSVPLYKESFKATPLNIIKEPEFHQRDKIINQIQQADYLFDDNYLAYLENSGLVGTCNSIFLSHSTKKTNEFGVPTTVIFYESSEYKGNAYFKTENKTVNVEMTNNKFRISFEPGTNDELILNQNYFSGWKSDRPVFEIDGKPAVKVNPEDNYIEFYYVQKNFLLGLIITILSLLLFCFITIFFNKNNKK